MAKATPIAVWLAMTCTSVATQGCREDEQDRPLAYDKGVYRGQPDQTLDDQQVEALRQRTAGQKF
jgi:hypothetical protein